jgi:single-strand DNA-binding protein
MTQSINKVILIGNLGRDPELRYTPSGKPVTTLSVATSSRTKNRKTNEWEDSTQWHRVTVHGDAAEWAGQKLTKGRTVYVEGSLKYGSYTNKDGVRIPTAEIVSFQVEPFGAKKTSDQSDGADAHGQSSAGDAQMPDDLSGWVGEYDKA